MGNGLSIFLVDNKLFRKALTVTSQFGLQGLDHLPGGKVHTNLPHHTMFSEKHIPATDEKLDQGFGRKDKEEGAFSIQFLFCFAECVWFLCFSFTV